MAAVRSLGKVLADCASHECRWPVEGQGEAARFCAAEVAPGDWKPWKAHGCYCRTHRQLSVGHGTEAERSAPRVLERMG